VPRFILLDKKGTLVQLTFISSNAYCCTYGLNWRYLDCHGLFQTSQWRCFVIANELKQSI